MEPQLGKAIQFKLWFQYNKIKTKTHATLYLLSGTDDEFYILLEVIRPD